MVLFKIFLGFCFLGFFGFFFNKACDIRKNFKVGERGRHIDVKKLNDPKIKFIEK